MPDHQDAFRNFTGSLLGLRISPKGFIALYHIEGCLRLWPDEGQIRFSQDRITRIGDSLNRSLIREGLEPASRAETLYICMLCELSRAEQLIK